MTGQAEFLTALLDPAQPAPEGLRNPHGGPAGARFDVYRNNVVVSLTEALITGFPTVHKLVGDAFFRAMAGVFLRAHPPGDPRLPLYGSAFPGFLMRFDRVAHLPYLPDIAKLDLGMRQSYHAADVTRLSVAGIAPEAVMDLAPRLSPATLILSSRFAVHDIWAFTTLKGAPKPGGDAQDVMITRPAFDPEPHLLPEGGFTLARHLKGKLTLQAALTATITQHPAADMAALMTLFLTSGALTLDPAKDPAP